MLAATAGIRKNDHQAWFAAWMGLADRTAKFGQYSQSLSMHTGIFGLQTKKDIRRSNDILMDIVKTDDSIYTELKILLVLRCIPMT